MVFRTVFIGQAPDGDPKKHRASIKTSKLEAIFIIVKLGDIEGALAIAKHLAEKEGIQSLQLCPGWRHEDVARFRQAVGENVSIFVSRGDIPSSLMTAQVLSKEGWFPERT